MGGRGASLSSGGGSKVDVIGTTDVWSFRHHKTNERYVDAINTGVAAVQKDFPDLMESVYNVNTARLGGSSKTHVLGFFSYDSNGNTSINLNQHYVNVEKMNRTYDKTVKSGYHPSRGKRTGTEAVSIHETGHALTYHLQKAYKAKDIDGAAKKIVNNAYKSSGGKGGTKKFAEKISGYAKESYAECVAEAVADWYCNGNKASSASKAIVSEMKHAYSTYIKK
jgi:hypothetical protein